MGRVRRYKKYKACDPASRKFGKEIDTKHDEPPELFEQRARKINRDRDSKWDDEERREHLLQREALREIRMNEQKDRLKEKKIESKRADESMQAFKARVKQEIRKTLVTEVQKMTATAQKRKQRLKERSLKRKGKIGKKSDEDENEFFAAENGHIRPSDRGESRTTFRDAEEVAFGERAERPPDLQQFTAKFKAAKNKAGQDAHSQQQAQQQQHGNEDDSDAEEESEEEEEAVQLSKNQRRKKRKAEGLAHRSDMDGDDGLEGGLRGSADTALLQRAFSMGAKPGQGGGGGKHRPASSAGAGKAQQGVSSGRNSGATAAAAAMAKVTAGPVGVKAQNEMDALRLKVQEAYRQLRDKRRAQI